MKKEIRTVVYDDELKIEAYRFERIVQPFPSHFHEYYVIGFVEKGERVLSCQAREYAIRKGASCFSIRVTAMPVCRVMKGRLITGDLTFQRRSCSIWRRAA